jgi:predicted Fe-Mo cluster-binding NifX family protein
LDKDVENQGAWYSMKKIAFPTEDGQTIFPHFGRAPFFVVAALDDNGSAVFEQRDKAYHGEQHSHSLHETPHGHSGMFAPISDCQVLIAGGMGQPAYRHAIEAGLTVIMTGERSIAAALQAYQNGTLSSDERRIHQHH